MNRNEMLETIKATDQAVIESRQLLRAIQPDEYRNGLEEMQRLQQELLGIVLSQPGEVIAQDLPDGSDIDTK